MFGFDFCFPKAAEAVNFKMTGWRSDSGTWQIYKKILKEIKENADTLLDFDAQFFCINDRISYPINSLDRQPVSNWQLLPPLES